MTFDPHRGYFHDGLPGERPAVTLTHEQLAELVAGRTPAAIVASHVFGAMWTGEADTKAASDADFGERMARFAHHMAAAAGRGTAANPQVEVKPARRLSVQLRVHGRQVWAAHYDAGQFDQVWRVDPVLPGYTVGERVELRIVPASPADQ